MLTYLFKSCFLPKTLSDIFLREQKQAEQLLQRHLGGKWPIWLITFLPFGHDGENFWWPMKMPKMELVQSVENWKLAFTPNCRK
jgi:hypothetical protein